MKKKIIFIWGIITFSLLFGLTNVNAAEINITTADLENENNNGYQYDPTFGYRLPSDLEKNIRDAEAGDVINLSPGDYTNFLVDLNENVVVNFTSGEYTNLFIRVKNNVTFKINGNVTFNKNSSSKLNYAAIWISGNSNDTVHGSLTITGDNLTIKGYSLGITGQRFDAKSNVYDSKLTIENKSLTITDLKKDGTVWERSWIQPTDTLATWQHGAALFFTGKKDSIPKLTIKNGSRVYLTGNGNATNIGTKTATGIYFSTAGIVDIIENSKLIIDGVSGNAFHVQADTGLENSYFKVNIKDSSLGIRNTGVLGMNNLNTASEDIQKVVIDNSKVIVTAGKNAGVQYGTFKILNKSKVLVGTIPNEYKDIYKEIFETELTEENNVGNDRDGFYVSALTLKDSSLIANGNNCSGINITSKEAVIENSYVEASLNGTTKRNDGWKPSRKMGIFFHEGANVSDSKIITNNNGQDITGVSAGNTASSLSGIVASKEVKFLNSFVKSTDPYAWNLYNTSDAKGVILIDNNTISIAEGSYLLTPPLEEDKNETGNNDIVDDYNGKGNTGTIIVEGGSLQTSEEVNTENYDKPYKDINSRVEIVNKDNEKLYRFDLHENINKEVGKNSEQKDKLIKEFIYYHKNGLAHNYTFRFNKLGEDLEPSVSGNAYVWTPYTIVKYDATEGNIVLNNSTATLGSSNRYAMDITIYGNSLNLAEKTMPTATREGYTFEGWFIAANNGEVEFDKALSLANTSNFNELYKILNTKYDESSKALANLNDESTAAEEITLYAKWSKKGTVIAHYVDEDGNPLRDDIKTIDVVGNAYQTKVLEIEDYILKEIKGNENGKYVDGIIEVTYIYKFKDVPSNPEPITPPQTGMKEEQTKSYFNINTLIFLIIGNYYLLRKYK